MALKHIRIRNYIAKILKNDKRDTRSILDEINSHFSHGTSVQILNNLLAKDPRFEKVGTTTRAGIITGHYELCLWTLRQ